MPPELIGKQGELLVSSKLGWINLWGYRGMVLQNVYVPKQNGETAEIDLLFIRALSNFADNVHSHRHIFPKETDKSI